MNEIEKKYSAIVKLIRKYENGDASKLMQAVGLPYEINHGLSMPDLQKIASQFEKDNAFADNLREKNIREHRLLADMLSDSETLSFNEACEIVKTYHTSELAESGAKFLLQHASFAYKLAEYCFAQKTDYCLMTGFAIVALKIRNEADDNLAIFETTLSAFKENILNKNMNVSRNAARAMRGIAGKNIDLKNKVIHIFDEFSDSQNPEIAYLREEVLALI